MSYYVCIKDRKIIGYGTGLLLLPDGDKDTVIEITRDEYKLVSACNGNLYGAINTATGLLRKVENEL